MKIFSMTPIIVVTTALGAINSVAMIITKAISNGGISELDLGGKFIYGMKKEVEWIDYFLTNHLKIPHINYSTDLLMTWICVFSILIVYPISEAIVNWKQGDEDNDEKVIFSIIGKTINIMHITTMFNIIQSSIILMIFSYIISSITTTHVGYFPNVVVAIIGVLGTQLYHLIGSLWDAMYLREWHARYLKTLTYSRMEQIGIGSIRRNKRIVYGTVISIIFTLLLDFYGFKYSGIMTLIFLLFLFSIYWIFDSWLKQAKKIANENESKWKAMMRSSHFQVGLLILLSYVLAPLRSASIIASQFEPK